MERANDPTALLEADWGARQAQLAEMKANNTLWSTYGADPTAYQEVRTELTNLGFTLFPEGNNLQYVSSAESRTIWAAGRPDQLPHTVQQLPPQGQGRAGQGRHLLAGQSQPARRADLARRQGRVLRHQRLCAASRRRPRRDGRRAAPGRAESGQFRAPGGPDQSQRSRGHLQLPVQFGHDEGAVEDGRDRDDRADRTQLRHEASRRFQSDLRGSDDRVQEERRRPPRRSRHLHRLATRRRRVRQQRRACDGCRHRGDRESEVQDRPLCRFGRHRGRDVARLHGLSGRHLGRHEPAARRQLVVARLRQRGAGLALRVRAAGTLHRRGAAQHYDGQCRRRRRFGRPVCQRPDQHRGDAFQSLRHRERRHVAQQPGDRDRGPDLAGHRGGGDGPAIWPRSGNWWPAA